MTTIPTIGFNVESVTYRNLNFNVWVNLILLHPPVCFSHRQPDAHIQKLGSRRTNFHPPLLALLLCQYRRRHLRRRLDRYRAPNYLIRRAGRDAQRGRIARCGLAGLCEQAGSARIKGGSGNIGSVKFGRAEGSELEHRGVFGGGREGDQ